MHQHHGHDDKDRNAKFSVNGSRRTTNGEQNERRLSSNGVLVVTEGQTHVQPDQSEHEGAQNLAFRKTEAVQPTPTPRIEGKPVEKFHRNNHPGDAQEVHGLALYPALAKVEPNPCHQQQSKPTEHRRQHRTDQGANRGPHHHHGHRQPFADGLLSVNRQFRRRVGHRFRCLFHGEEVSNLANRCV